MTAENTANHTESTELARESRSLMATPKSTVWQILLGAPATLGLGLVGVLGTNLLTDSFKANPVVQLTTVVVGWIALVLFVIGLVLRSYRFVRAHVELPSAASPESPELPKPGGPWAAAPEPDHRSGLRDVWAAAVLRDLPMRTFELPVLLDVLAASAAARMPISLTPADEDMPAAPRIVDQLVGVGVLELSIPGRYRVAAVPPESETPRTTGTPEWRAALAMLLRRHAEQSARWARALDVPSTAATARLWFQDEEPRLGALLARCAEMPGLEQVRAVVPDLAAIADALDTWYARTGKPEDYRGRGLAGEPVTATGPAAAMITIAETTGSGLAGTLADIRQNAPEREPLRYSPRTLSRSLRARALHRRALKTLGPGQTQLADAVNLLEQAWWLLPREDVAGEVSALVNMAIVHLLQGRYTAARDRLELAESMATGSDPGGLAHVHEIAGALDWASGDQPRAIWRWQTALAEWRALADELGTGRCLQHLGSAVVTEPGLGIALLESEDPATDFDLLLLAAGWLVEAKRLNPGLNYVGSRAGELFAKLNDAAPPGTRVHALPGLQRWPRAPRDQPTGST
ncbi:hypothetical protein GPX89_14440 [Nocardia sp. ET3-3]|uniref:Tetratricopeptide repeat protein n=1 Tax=Nocardia terrae TaxID=2675851 RepID=A0A7K1UVP1_9NOCA|nr:hypothetical protein [Nocardia terrae]MVU78440.1 hypothetical protein [Nocardia terrae]